MRCICLLSSGESKGNQCKNNAKAGFEPYCGVHFGRCKATAGPNPNPPAPPKMPSPLKPKSSLTLKPKSPLTLKPKSPALKPKDRRVARVLLYCHGRAMEITDRIKHELAVAAALLDMDLPDQSQFESINITKSADPTIMATPEGDLPAEYYGKFDIVYDVNCDNTGWATTPTQYERYTKRLYLNMLMALKDDHMALILAFYVVSNLPTHLQRMTQWKEKVLGHIMTTAAATKGSLTTFEDEELCILYKLGGS